MYRLSSSEYRSGVLYLQRLFPMPLRGSFLGDVRGDHGVWHRHAPQRGPPTTPRYQGLPFRSFDIYLVRTDGSLMAGMPVLLRLRWMRSLTLLSSQSQVKNRLLEVEIRTYLTQPQLSLDCV